MMYYNITVREKTRLSEDSLWVLFYSNIQNLKEAMPCYDEQVRRVGEDNVRIMAEFRESYIIMGPRE